MFKDIYFLADSARVWAAKGHRKPLMGRAMIQRLYISFGLPVLLNLIAAALGAVLFSLSQAAPVAMSGCNSEAETLSVQAEVSLMKGSLAEANGLSSDSVQLAPSCLSVGLVRATVESKLMLEAAATRRVDQAEYWRSDCYVRASRSARTQVGSAQAEALLQVCAASAVARIGVEERLSSGSGYAKQRHRR